MVFHLCTSVDAVPPLSHTSKIAWVGLQRVAGTAGLPVTGVLFLLTNCNLKEENDDCLVSENSEVSTETTL